MGLEGGCGCLVCGGAVCGGHEGLLWCVELEDEVLDMGIL